jgi:hypothetical protein
VIEMNKTAKTNIVIAAAFAAHRMAMCMCPCMQTVGEKAGT